jgi:hypothetical protein
MRRQDPGSKAHAWRGLILAAAILIVMFASSTVAWGQGCAMCYNSAAAAKASAIQALKQGILVLLFPPLAMFIGIFALAFRRRHRFNDDETAETIDARQALHELRAFLPSAGVEDPPANRRVIVRELVENERDTSAGDA